MPRTTCSVEGCERPIKRRSDGLCQEHHYRLSRFGDVHAIPRGPASAPRRFWLYVDKNGPDGCWLWTGGLGTGGYGQFKRVQATTDRAHRFAYELLIGPIPPGMQLDHLCRNRRCVNPEHLEPVTGRENKLRGHTLNAANAAKTHCDYGHPFDEQNTYTTTRSSRCCRACSRRRNAEYRARKAARGAA